MKTSFVWQKQFVASAAVALGLMVGATAWAQPEAKALRVGVYDSRAVAVAYHNSAEFRKAMEGVTADYKQAKEAKHEKRVKEIEAQMKARQRRSHEQGFSTGSVANVMAKVKDSLPAVARKAGVDLLVSKWELNYQSSDVKVVDVTDDLVALFQVSEKGMKWVKDIKNHAPLPIEQITEDMD